VRLAISKADEIEHTSVVFWLCYAIHAGWSGEARGPRGGAPGAALAVATGPCVFCFFWGGGRDKWQD
jgi:hypothetical protein